MAKSAPTQAEVKPEETPAVEASNPVNLEGVAAGTSVTLADGTVITNY
jgi:hypothetical protein